MIHAKVTDDDIVCDCSRCGRLLFSELSIGRLPSKTQALRKIAARVYCPKLCHERPVCQRCHTEYALIKPATTRVVKGQVRY